MPAGQVLDQFDEIFSCPPQPLPGYFSAGSPHIHTPWRKEEVIFACDLLDVIGGNSENFLLEDDFKVWPERDFSRWENFARSWGFYLGARETYPED